MDEDAELDEEFEGGGDDPDDPEFDEDEGLDDELESDLDEDEDALPEAEADVADEDEDEEPAVPPQRARSGEDDEDDEELDPDDVEADLDTILKDRIASGDEGDEDEEEEVPLDRNDPELGDGVIHKREGEFTCTGCFMIVHPRQFGRKGHLVCPVGDEDCPSLAIIAAQK